MIDPKLLKRRLDEKTEEVQVLKKIIKRVNRKANKMKIKVKNLKNVITTLQESV